jgi:ornithine carbamoyltransferase
MPAISRGFRGRRVEVGRARVPPGQYVTPDFPVLTARVTPATGPSDLLRIADLDPARLEQLLELAAEMKANPFGWRFAQAGKLLVCLFAKPSTRTRVSLEAAASRLGMLPVMLRPDELQLGRGESIADTGRVLSGYAAAIAIRTFAQREVADLADAASVPVINALTDEHHPCQALADLLTLHERFGRLAGLRLAYVGDGNNVAHSLIEAGALAGMHVAIAAPPGYEPAPEVAASATSAARATGGTVNVMTDPHEAVRGADAVYTDVWVSMGDDDERAERLARFGDYRITPELMRLAGPEAVFMHCLPAHRGEEVDAAVIDGPRSVVFEQAGNCLPAMQAVLQALISGDWSG